LPSLKGPFAVWWGLYKGDEEIRIEPVALRRAPESLGRLPRIRVRAEVED
jgi:hypothetical protein